MNIEQDFWDKLPKGIRYPIQNGAGWGFSVVGLDLPGLIIDEHLVEKIPLIVLGLYSCAVEYASKRWDRSYLLEYKDVGYWQATYGEMCSRQDALEEALGVKWEKVKDRIVGKKKVRRKEPIFWLD